MEHELLNCNGGDVAERIAIRNKAIREEKAEIRNEKREVELAALVEEELTPEAQARRQEAKEDRNSSKAEAEKTSKEKKAEANQLFLKPEQIKKQKEEELMEELRSSMPFVREQAAFKSYLGDEVASGITKVLDKIS